LEVGSGHLLARKEINDLQCTVLGVGRNATVNVYLFNAGDGSAYDVKIADSLPKRFQLVEGSLTADLGEILAGETSTFSYQMKTNETQIVVRNVPAKITYRRNSEGAFFTANSSIPSTKTRVIASFEYARLVESHYIDFAIMFGLFCVSVPAPGLFWWRSKNNRLKEE